MKFLVIMLALYELNFLLPVEQVCSRNYAHDIPWDMYQIGAVTPSRGELCKEGRLLHGRNKLCHIVGADCVVRVGLLMVTNLLVKCLDDFVSPTTCSRQPTDRCLCELACKMRCDTFDAAFRLEG